MRYFNYFLIHGEAADGARYTISFDFGTFTCIHLEYYSEALFSSKNGYLQHFHYSLLDGESADPVCYINYII